MMTRGISVLSKQKGFTIVELLIVIVIIGILAVLIIVAYNGIQNRAKDTAIQADLTAASKKLELYYIDYGTYPPNSVSLSDVGISATKSSYDITSNLNFLFCNAAISGISTTYALLAKSPSGTTYMVTHQNKNPVTYTASTFPTSSTTICNNALGTTSVGRYWGYNAGSGNWQSWVSG